MSALLRSGPGTCRFHYVNGCGAAVHRVRNAVDVFPADERIGRLAGYLLGNTDGTNTVDALVAAEAVLSEADVLTADPDDLRALLAKHPRVAVIPL